MPRKKKETIIEKLNTSSKAVEMKLEDMEGIGPVKLKKLYMNNIYTLDDLTSYGEESLVRMLDISYEDASKMIRTAVESMHTEDTMSSMIMGGREFAEFRDKEIEFMTTGLAELDEITGMFETGVITEFFGAYGSGKTQFMMVSAIMAQLPKNRTCLHCGKEWILPIKPVEPSKPKELNKETTTEALEEKYKKDLEKFKENKEQWNKDIDAYKIEMAIKNRPYCECEGKIEGDGLSEFGKPTRVIYIDSENSYRPERLKQIVINRDYVLTKPQTATAIKKQENKVPINEEEDRKADEFVWNIDRVHPRTSGLQMFAISNLSSMIAGDFCQVCHKREINELNEPTHQNHPKAKPDMELFDHDFKQDKPSKIVIVDSLTGKFRKEYEGRGTLSDRQTKLSTQIKLLEGSVESKNVICLVTNQAQELLGVMGDNTRPIGGNTIAHTFTHRIYLKKPQSLTKNKITAILVDSPNKAKNEITLELGSKGIQEETL